MRASMIRRWCLVATRGAERGCASSNRAALYSTQQQQQHVPPPVDSSTKDSDPEHPMDVVPPPHDGTGDHISTTDRNSRILESIASLDDHHHHRGSNDLISSLKRERGAPLTGFQRGLLSILSSWGAFRDPRRADLVAIVGEVTGEKAVSLIRDRMRMSEEGRRVLEERPRVTDADTLARAQDMPAHTFGGAYAAFMNTRGFHADERPAVRFIDDPELAYVVARMREVHDFWHVLFDCHTDVLGEAALKAVEFMQTGMPMTGMAVIAAEWRLSRPKRRILNTVYLPWAVQAGAQAADLACLYYEEHLHRDLNEVREAWRILKRPIPPDTSI